MTLFRVMNPPKRCLQAKVKYWNEPKQVMPTNEDLSRSLEICAIWTLADLPILLGNHSFSDLWQL